MLCSRFLYGSVGDWGVDGSDVFNGLVTGGVYLLVSEMSIDYAFGSVTPLACGPATRYLVAVFLFSGRLLIAAVLDLADDVSGQVLDTGALGGRFEDGEDEFVVVIVAELARDSLTDSVLAETF